MTQKKSSYILYNRVINIVYIGTRKYVQISYISSNRCFCDFADLNVIYLINEICFHFFTTLLRALTVARASHLHGENKWMLWL